MAAIYMWFEPEIQILTTTLYPVEMTEAVAMSADFHSGDMWTIPNDNVYVNGVVAGVTLSQILITAGPEEDSINVNGNVVQVQLLTILITGPTSEDEINIAGQLSAVRLVTLLVTVDTPDESAQISCDIYPAGCSMSLV